MPRVTSPVRDIVLAALLFSALTIVMTWPQARVMSSHVASHFDSFFSVWRLAWIAHQLPSAPLELYQANIFYPQRFSLALSDPILQEGLTAAPLLWLGASPIFAYNLLVLASFVLCGTAAWALASRLTGSRLAGVIAGVVFAFAPYRYEHFYHLEILWAFWIPVAFLALHRAVDLGTVRAGLHVGLAVIAQALACLYYAVYLGIVLSFAGPLLVRWRDAHRVRTVAGLAAGAVAATLFVFVYIQPLLSIRSELLPRVPADADGYSARAVSYLATPERNRVYGRYLGPFGSGELRLFPGIAAVVFAVGALRHARRQTFVYLVVFGVAIVGSLGTNAPFFNLVRGASELVSMLRVPARFFAVALCALGVLAAMGTAAFLATLHSPRTRLIAAGVIAGIMLVEYSTVLDLQEVRTDPAPVYQWLARQPRGAVVEFPMPRPHRLPGPEPYRQYNSTLHWQPLMNGYSGHYPVAYRNLLLNVAPFPRGGWMDVVVARGVRYIVLHERELSRDDLMEALRRLEGHPSFRRIARFSDPADPTWVYERTERRLAGHTAR
ncbi:MAG TPA: hypothetical protein VK886_09730 [Vicinamibacterales bacterium]|nr:hypothetical protein [Vicinamibacterales bacterium]